MVAMTLGVQRAHVVALASAGGVRLVELAQLQPDDAIAGNGVVICRPVVDDTSYAVALHELGHELGEGGKPLLRGVTSPTEFMRRKVRAERAAWVWARAHALQWTAAMEQVRTWALKTYTDGLAVAETSPAVRREMAAVNEAPAERPVPPPSPQPRPDEAARAKAYLKQRFGWS